MMKMGSRAKKKFGRPWSTVCITTALHASEETVSHPVNA